MSIEAEQAFRKALQSDPHHPEAVYNTGLLEWSKTGNPDYELSYKAGRGCKNTGIRG